MGCHHQQGEASLARVKDKAIDADEAKLGAEQPVWWECKQMAENQSKLQDDKAKAKLIEIPPESAEQEHKSSGNDETVIPDNTQARTPL